MASLLRKAYLAEGTHKVSLINSGKGARPMVNGGILSGSKNVDNGTLVEFDGFDVINVIVNLKTSKCVQHHLWIPLIIY